MICRTCGELYNASNESAECPHGIIDLVEISKAEVIEKARIALKRWRTTGTAVGMGFDDARIAFNAAEVDLIAAIVLLESREAMIETELSLEL